MDFGERLAGVRARANLSQEGLARAAGVSRQTIYNLETAPGWRIRASTALLVGEALVERGAMSRDDVYWYARETGVRVEHLLRVLPMVDGRGRAPDPATAELHAMVEALAEREGAEYVRGVLEALRSMPREAGQAGATPRTLAVHHPPVQRQGYTERRVSTYEVPPEPAPVSPAKAKARRSRRASG